MKETILIFNIPEKDRRLKLEMALFPLHVRIRYAADEDCGQKLGYLAGLKEIPAREETYEGPGVPETMLVFAFFDDNKLNQTLSAIRRSGLAPIPYKAVLTPTNADWTPLECFAEIKEEHEVMSKMAAEKKKKAEEGR